MSWNGNDKKDPWGRNDGPPDIDEAVKQVKAKINSIFGGGSGGKSGAGPTKKSFLYFFRCSFVVVDWFWSISS